MSPGGWGGAQGGTAGCTGAAPGPVGWGRQAGGGGGTELLSLLQPLDAGLHFSKVVLHNGQVLLHRLLDLWRGGGGEWGRKGAGGQNGEPPKAPRWAPPLPAARCCPSERQPPPAAWCPGAPGPARTARLGGNAGRQGQEQRPPLTPLHPPSAQGPAAPHPAHAGPAGSAGAAPHQADCWPRGPSAASSHRPGGSGR